MDPQSCTNQIKKTQHSSEQLDDFGLARSDSSKDPPPPAAAAADVAVEPITPEPTRETGDFHLPHTSPLSVVKILPKALSFNSLTAPVSSLDNGSSPKTPKDGVFNPFAPGPDDLALAPRCKKSFDEARPFVARRLNFDDALDASGDASQSVDPLSFSDEEMFESVYENLLEAILSNQTEMALAELPDGQWDSDSCRTPPKASRLSGVAATCPGAPLRPVGKLRVVDLGSLCKKLEL